MPRPSKKQERRVEILDAYGRCIARYGVDGTTLEMTADEARLARALIRHNVGNKDDILAAFLDRWLAAGTAEADELFDGLPERDRIDTLITWLFDPQYHDPDADSVANALFTAATHRPTLAERLRRWTSEFTDRIAQELRVAYPDTDGDVDSVATGIVAIYFNFETLAPLGQAKKLRKASQSAARLLVSTLKN